MSPVQKKIKKGGGWVGEEAKGKVVEHNNKHWRDSKMDSMSPYTTEKGGGVGVGIKVAGGKQ